MRTMTLVIAALVLTAQLLGPISSPQAADNPDAVPFFMSGNSLLEPCRLAAKDGTAQAACVLYIVGVVDAFNQNPATRFCLPLATTRVDIANVVVNWLDQHPALTTGSAPLLVSMAMKEAYPCAAAPAVPPAKR